MWLLRALRILATDVPVDPSAAEAQQWAVDELSKSVYQSQQGIARIWDRIIAFLGDLFSGALLRDDPLAVILLVLAITALVILAVVGTSRIRTNARARASGGVAMFDDARSARALREDARAALAAGDTARAYLDSFRAIIRSLDERALLDDRAGMTAHEATTIASGVFPSHAQGLTWASETFDSVHYGKQRVQHAEVEALWRLDEAIGTARPQREAAASLEPVGL